MVGREPCPKCGSRDNLTRYDDGHAYCYGQGCGHYEPPGDEPGGSSVQGKPMTAKERPGLIRGEYADLPSRGLRADTLKKFRYQLGEFASMRCHAAPYVDDEGETVAQKIRLPDKEFTFAGDPSRVRQLFGQQVWGSGGRRVIVTEGEVDCLTVAQVLDLKWPVVSVMNGAGDEKSISRSLAWLETFDEVVFMYDGDEAGRKGARAAARLLSPGKAKIADLPDGKDPNDLLTSGNSAAIQQAIWQAKPYRPDSIRSLSDLVSEAVRPVQYGLSLPYPTLHRLTYGPKPGQLWIGGAGVGIGKTQVFTDMEAHALRVRRKVGVFHLEQPPVETVQRIAAVLAGKPFFKPDCEYTEAELRAVIEPFEDQLFIYDHTGSSEWEEIERHVRWLVKAHGVEEVFIDNLTVLSAEAEDERRFLDRLLKDMKSLATGLGIVVHTLSHLSTPEGRAHEEGGRVIAKQLTGSRAIIRYADVLWALERDTQSECAVTRATSTFRILKDRVSGQSTGQTFHLKYDPVLSRMEEAPAPPTKDKDNGKSAEDYGF